MQKFKSLLAIPIIMGATALIVPPSESQVVGVPEKAIQKVEKAARKAAEKARKAAEEKIGHDHVVGGCAGTREGCDPEKKIKNIFNKKMKKCVKAPCPVW